MLYDGTLPMLYFGIRANGLQAEIAEVAPLHVCRRHRHAAKLAGGAIDAVSDVILSPSRDFGPTGDWRQPLPADGNAYFCKQSCLLGIAHRGSLS